MGFAQSIITQVEVAAPPETVRSVLLDFNRYKEWHEVFTLRPVDAAQQPLDLKPKDKLKVDIKGTGFTASIIENTPASFQWLGSLPGIFSGQHQFYFGASQQMSGGTTLVQKEDFWGLLVFLLAPGWSFRKQTEENFQQLNRDLKAEAEKRSRT